MPPMKYFGGKTKIRKEIIKKMPPHQTYVEPFAGSGTVLLAKPPSKREVLNDKSPEIMKVHKSVKARAQVWHLSKSRRRWEEIKRKQPSQRSAEETAYLIGHSFNGLGKNWSNHSREGNYDVGRIHQREKDVIMASTDFADTMRRWDSETTLHYLDPPYVQGGDEYAVHGVTPKRVAEVAGKMKGKVIVSYDDRQEVRRAFGAKKWRKNTIGHVYSSGTGGLPGRPHEIKHVRELLVTNYDIGKTRASAPPFDESRAKKQLHT